MVVYVKLLKIIKHKMKKNFLSLLLLLVSNFFWSQQRAIDVTINLLANDKIATVNVDSDSFIKSIGKVIDYCEKEFKDYPKTQKIGIFLTAHKTGNPTYKIYAEPALKAEVINKVLADLNNISVENTKILDFPIFLSINSKNEGEITDFKDFTDPEKLKIENYKKADLKTKFQLNKEYAINEVLPILAAYQTIVDDKFAGVKSFGNLISSTNFNEKQDIDKLTSTNKNYWRATMEMEMGNELIPITKIFALTAQGEFDYAYKYIEMISLFSKDNIPQSYLKNLKFRLDLFNNDLTKEIEKGIELHDKGEYDKAIAIYEAILKMYPNSAWTLYEKYYSKNAKDLKENKVTRDDRKEWDKDKIEIYKHNPLYHMDVRASNGTEAYFLFRRQEVNTLFKEKDNFLKDLFEYAQIASDLKVYDFASQLFWLSFGYDKDRQKEAINHYLFCLDKLGEKNLKSNFKGNFDTIFKKIEEQKEKEIKSSEIYKSFKN